MRCVSSVYLVSSRLKVTSLLFRLLRTLFEMAREKSPSVIFFGEIESLSKREPNVDNSGSSEFEKELCKQLKSHRVENEGAIVVGETSAPWLLSADVKEMFDNAAYFTLPKAKARTEMFKHFIDSMNAISNIEFEELGRKSIGYSGADIYIAVQDAHMIPLREAQNARFFRGAEKGMLEPVLQHPPCPHWSTLNHKGESHRQKCKKCNVTNMSFDDVDPDKLKLLPVSMANV